jgi:hypothetical protein
VISLDHSQKVQAVLRNLKRKTLDLDTFLAEVQDKKYSGEARVTTTKGQSQVLFYRGVPLVSSDRRTPSMPEVRTIMNDPDATLNFFLLGDELAHAFLSVFQGERVWEGLSISVFHVDKMLGKLMEKNPTGHLCIHKGKTDRHYCFFFQGRPIGVYDLERHWSPVDVSTMWEDAQQVDYFLSGTIESVAPTAATVRSSTDFQYFLSSWNDLVAAIAKKLGKKPVEKSLQKSFGELPYYRVDGISLRLTDEGSPDVSNALRVFQRKTPDFLKEMEVIVGRGWLTSQLQEFRERNGDIVEKLSLTELFPKKGG